MLVRILLILLCFTSVSQAQLQNFLTALTQSDSGATILGNPSGNTSIKFLLHHHATVTDSIMSSLQQYGKQDGNYASLSAAVSAAASDTASLIISKRHAITASDTLDGMADIIVLRGGYFNISNNVILTFDVPFYAGSYQIFEGSGMVRFLDGSVSETNVEWWGTNQAALDSAITIAAADTSALIISKRYAITTDDTLTGMSSVVVKRGGYFNIGSGDTLTFNVPFSAGLYQIFEGSGTVMFMEGSTPIIEVEWFGSGQAGVNKAIQSLDSTGGNIRFSKAITITDSILIDKRATHFYGAGRTGNLAGLNPSSTIKVSSGSSDAIVVTGSNALLENFTIDGLSGKNGDDGIRLESLSTIREVAVIRMGGNGIRMGQDSNNMNGWILQNVFTFKNDSNGVYIHDSGGAPDTNAGVAFYLYSKDNGLDGLRLENTLDNQFYMYRGDTNAGYGIRLKSGAKGHFFSFPYLEANTTGEGIIESGALQNFIFGTRQGTDDSWVDQETSDDNVIHGRNNSLNDMYQFQGNIAFEQLSFFDDPFELSGFWTIMKDSSGSTRNLEIISRNGNGVNANLIVKRSDDDASGIIGVVIEDGGLTATTGTFSDNVDINTGDLTLDTNRFWGINTNNSDVWDGDNGTMVKRSQQDVAMIIDSDGNGSAETFKIQKDNSDTDSATDIVIVEENGNFRIIANDTLAINGFQTAAFAAGRDAFWFDPGGDTLFVKNNGTVRFILTTAYSGSGH